MKSALIWGLWILLAVQVWGAPADSTGLIIKGKSGIKAIDTLPVHEWDVPTQRNDLKLALGLGLIIPGGAQFYQQHTVRGGFLMAIEAGLAYEIWINKPLQRERRQQEVADARDSVAHYTRLLIQDGRYYPQWVAARQLSLKKIRDINDIKMKEEDLRKSEEAWLLGLHLFGLMDGYGIWVHNQGRSVEKREVLSALWRAAVIPGYGQIYNQEYGKAGLLYMSIIGGVVSFQSRQNMVEYFLDRKRTAVQEGASVSELSEIDEDILFFRKKRNQYSWGLALFYLYSMADAAVDAALSDFDSPLFWALVPRADGLGIETMVRF